MDDLLEWKHQIGEDTLYALTKYALTGDIQYENLKNLKMNLFAWMEPIQTKEEYYEHYIALKRLMEIIEQSGLLIMVEKLSRNDMTNYTSEEAVKTYQMLLENPEYLECVQKSRIRIPRAFAQKENYQKNTLMRKVIFLKRFYEEVAKINENLNGKEVSL